MITIHTEKHRLRAAKTELYGGELVPPFECPERVEFILGRLREVRLGEVHPPEAQDDRIIRAIHHGDYLDFLASAWKDWVAAGMEGEAIPTVWPSRRMPRQVVPPFIDGKLGWYALAGETSISEGTWEAARASADVALTAAGLVSGGARTAFALCRPPGHHAAQDMYGGYCFLNNAAIAAEAMRDAGAAQVAILDVDFHHGNGTQAIFYDRSDVFFASLHGDPLEAFPHYLGGADEIGEGAGEGFNANYPLPRGTDWAPWSTAMEDALHRIAGFGAEALVISLGVDTFKEDPISFFRLESGEFTRMGERIAAAGLPTLFVMEGGYAVAEIGINTVNVLTGFEGA
ncbi:MAG: histone deacetylase family protein [Pseudomonadota bacterium]